MKKQNTKSYSGDDITMHNPVVNPWFTINYIVYKNPYSFDGYLTVVMMALFGSCKTEKSFDNLVQTFLT